MEEVMVLELPPYTFPTPCTITIAGPSGSGKTFLLIRGIIKYRKCLVDVIFW